MEAPWIRPSANPCRRESAVIRNGIVAGVRLPLAVDKQRSTAMQSWNEPGGTYLRHAMDALHLDLGDLEDLADESPSLPTPVGVYRGWDAVYELAWELKDGDDGSAGSRQSEG